MDGWIKIHRKLLDWEWYDDGNVVRVFLHLLLTANFEPKKWHGITIERGQLATSVVNLASQVHLTSKQIRIVLEKLKNTNEIDIQTTNKYTLITICKYADYQTQETAIGQTNGNQRATTKEIKNDNKEKNNNNILGEKTEQMEQVFQNGTNGTDNDNEYDNDNDNDYDNNTTINSSDIINADKSAKKNHYKESKKKYGEFENVLLTDEEAQKLHNEFGNDAIGIVDFLSSYRAEKGYKNKSDYLSIRRWVANAYFEQLNKNKNGNNATGNRSIQERAERIAEFAFAANGLQNG